MREEPWEIPVAGAAAPTARSASAGHPVRWLLPALGALALACGPSDRIATSDGSGSGGSSSGGSSSGGSGSGGSSSGGSSSGGSSSGGSGSGSGSSSGGTGVEVCDGVDNNGDGIIDNVDANADGVCDCLKVATLGFPGLWGTGDVFSTWLSAKSTMGASSLADAVLTAATLAPYQVIIVQDVRSGTAGQSGVGHGIGRSYSADEVEALRLWVAQGGGLMTLIGYADPSEVTNVNTLLAPHGLSYGSSQVLFGGGGTVPVTQWDASHPIAAGISRVGVNNGYPTQGAGTVVAWEQSNGQVDVGRALPVGEGHVFVWGDEWITYDTEWTQHTEYQVSHFWVNALKWLTAANQCQVPTPPGEW